MWFDFSQLFRGWGCQSGEYVVNNSMCFHQRLKADVRNNPTVLEAQGKEKSLLEPCGLAEHKHKYYYRVLNFNSGIKGWTVTVSERSRQLCYIQDALVGVSSENLRPG